MPPEWMWPLSDELEDWFKEVDAEREAKYGGHKDEVEEPEHMAQNELSAGRR